jgi:hypothetical protein
METRTEKVEKVKAKESTRPEPKRLDDPITQTLIWLNHELDRFRSSRGGPVRPEIAEIMGRAASTVSTWMTGVRKMPDEMLIPMVLAVYKIRLPIAEEFHARMTAAAPIIMRKMPSIPEKDQATQRESKAAAPAISHAETPSETPSVSGEDFRQTMQARNEQPAAPSNEMQSIAATMERELMPLSQQQDTNEEFKLTVARAADRVASVLQRLMDR